LNNLCGIRAEAGRGFIVKVQEFRELHRDLKENPIHRKAFELVDFEEQNFKVLAEMRGAIFFSKTYMDDQNIIRNLSDGNCLFHALGKGLSLLEPELRKTGGWNDDFPVDHANMRHAIHQWMLANLDSDEQLRAHIDSAIIEYCPILEEELEREILTLEVLAEDPNIDLLQSALALTKKKVLVNILKTVSVDKPGSREAHETYLAMTRDEGKFASSPQIYAFCNLNPAVGVRISRRIEIPGKNGAEPRMIISKDFDLPFNPEAKYVINPVYNVAGNHFDLLIETT
jgi:hypothetical protein